MRVEYAEPTVIDRIEEAIAQARVTDQRIGSIRLTEAELEEFCELSDRAVNKNCVYTYKHVRVAYDWVSDR